MKLLPGSESWQDLDSCSLGKQQGPVLSDKWVLAGNTGEGTGQGLRADLRTLRTDGAELAGRVLGGPRGLHPLRADMPPTSILISKISAFVTSFLVFIF